MGLWSLTLRVRCVNDRPETLGLNPIHAFNICPGGQLLTCQTVSVTFGFIWLGGRGGGGVFDSPYVLQMSPDSPGSAGIAGSGRRTHPVRSCSEHGTNQFEQLWRRSARQAPAGTATRSWEAVWSPSDGDRGPQQWPHTQNLLPLSGHSSQISSHFKHRFHISVSFSAQLFSAEPMRARR